MLAEFKKLRDNWPHLKAWVAPEEAERSQLRFINYFIEHTCNLRCSYCKVALQNIRVMNDTERQVAFGRLRLVSSDKTVLSIVGGEPTRRPEFLTRVISEATEAGFYVNLTTNGYKLDKSLIGQLGKI